MLRTKDKPFLGRRSWAPDVQGKVCLDNPGVVIDRMTRNDRRRTKGSFDSGGKAACPRDDDSRAVSSIKFQPPPGTPPIIA